MQEKSIEGYFQLYIEIQANMGSTKLKNKKDNSWELLVSFHCEGPGIKLRSSRLGWRCLYPTSHLASLELGEGIPDKKSHRHAPRTLVNCDFSALRRLRQDCMEHRNLGYILSLGARDGLMAKSAYYLYRGPESCSQHQY